MGYNRIMTAKNIFSDALTLPRQERARLAHELLVSLDAPQDPGAAEAWLVEIDRRAQEVENGTAVLEEWNTVRDRLTARWRARSA
jgi:putative addiction module component (TIGR02574 family)